MAVQVAWHDPAAANPAPVQVKLFNHPCVVEDAPNRAYGGHSAHVTGIRWGADGSYAVSIGGRDRAVLQWRLVPQRRAEEAHHVVAPWAALDDQGVVWEQRQAARR